MNNATETLTFDHYADANAAHLTAAALYPDRMITLTFDEETRKHVVTIPA